MSEHPGIAGNQARDLPTREETVEVGTHLALARAGGRRIVVEWTGDVECPTCNRKGEVIAEGESEYIDKSGRGEPE